jgi:hypothetical protein
MNAIVRGTATGLLGAAWAAQRELIGGGVAAAMGHVAGPHAPHAWPAAHQVGRPREYRPAWVPQASAPAGPHVQGRPIGQVLLPPAAPRTTTPAFRRARLAALRQQQLRFQVTASGPAAAPAAPVAATAPVPHPSAAMPAPKGGHHGFAAAGLLGPPGRLPGAMDFHAVPHDAATVMARPSYATDYLESVKPLHLVPERVRGWGWGRGSMKEVGGGMRRRVRECGARWQRRRCREL